VGNTFFLLTKIIDVFVSLRFYRSSRAFCQMLDRLIKLFCKLNTLSSGFIRHVHKLFVITFLPDVK